MSGDEFDFIARLSRLVSGGDAVVGIGDDAAVLDQPGGNYLLATVDMQVDGVHFRREHIPGPSLGRRLLAVNLSDIGAMGGDPRYALVSIAVPPNVESTYIESVYTGLGEAASENGVGIVGGNVSRTDGPLALDLTLLGDVPKDEVVLRSGGRVGDIVAVTGSLGRAAAARWILDYPANQDEDATRLALLHSRIHPRLLAGRALAAAHIPTAMLDISDGLAGDIRHMAAAGGVGVELHADALPVDPWVIRTAQRMGVDAIDLALGGGEDYELALALPPDRLTEARMCCAPVPLTPVGALVSPSSGLTLIRGAERQQLPPLGWRHR